MPAKSSTCGGFWGPASRWVIGVVVLVVAGAGGSAGAVEPSLEYEFSLSGFDADTPPGVIVGVGTFNFVGHTHTNVGAVDLKDVVVKVDGASWCYASFIPVGEGSGCGGTWFMSTLGQFVYMGAVSGSANGVQVSADDPLYFLVVDARIDVVRSVNGDDANLPPGAAAAVGSEVTWTDVVTNTGTVELIDLALTDDHRIAVDCGGSNVIPTLAPGQSATCRTGSTATEGVVTHRVTVTGMPNPTGIDASVPRIPLSDTDPATYHGVLAPPTTAPAAASPGSTSPSPPSTAQPPLSTLPGTLPATGPGPTTTLAIASAAILGLGTTLLAFARRGRRESH